MNQRQKLNTEYYPGNQPGSVPSGFVFAAARVTKRSGKGKKIIYIYIISIQKTLPKEKALPVPGGVWVSLPAHAARSAPPLHGHASF